MFKRLTRRLAVQAVRCFSLSPRNNLKAAVLGAGGNIGQPMSLFLKLTPCVHELALYDIKDSCALAADLAQVDTLTEVKGYQCIDELSNTLTGADVVVICASQPQTEDMTPECLYKANCKMIREFIMAIYCNCPKALIAIITDPVDSLVPFAACVLKQQGVYDPKRLFGVTTINVVRACNIYSQVMSINPTGVCFPVIGGNDSSTIIPVVSQCEPPFKGDKDELMSLIMRIRDAGSSPAKLSMAYATFEFVASLLKGLMGDGNVVECAYVESQVTPASFFATQVLLGCDGIANNLGLGQLSDLEKEMVKCIVPELQKSIEKGIDCARKDKEDDNDNEDDEDEET